MQQPDNEIHWFAARAANCRELKARDILRKYHVEHFIPTQKTLAVRGGRRKMVEKSLIGNLVFMHTTKEEACSLVNYNGLQVHFIPDRCGGNSMLIVPDKQMDDFRRVFEYSLLEGNPLSEEFVSGDRVQVIDGDLSGVEGEVYESPGGSYVVVTLYGLLQAKARVPAAFLRKL